MATFKKQERLCNPKIIDCIFKQGNSFLLYPFSVRWIINSDKQDLPPTQILFSAKKRNFKHAVKRNRIKRLMREAYRNKKENFYNLLSQENTKIYLSVLFLGEQILDYQFFSEKMEEIITRIIKQINKKNENTKTNQ